MVQQRVLIVEDDAGIRESLQTYLQRAGFDIVCCENSREANAAMLRARADAVICDYSLPDGTGIDILKSAKAIDPATPVILLSGYGTVELAVDALKAGAENFLAKPVELPSLHAVLDRALVKGGRKQKALVKGLNKSRDAFDPFAGTSSAIRKLAEKAHKIAASDRPILITGETGTGKTVLARWLHQNGPRSSEAFVDLNCASFSRELLESELFGHERGAFTGAISAKAGLFEVAHRGSIFLDEIGDVDLQIQPKMLKVLEDKQFRRIGEVRDRYADVRLIAATHQDLNQAVAEKRFREDLYFRISTIPVRVPPLRERKQDIRLLAETILESVARDLGRNNLALTGDAMTRLENHGWPGNIRELRNVLERAAILTNSDEIGSSDLLFDPPVACDAPKGVNSNMTLVAMEKAFIETVLREESGKVANAAARLGMPRSSLYQKIKEYQINVTDRVAPTSSVNC